MKAVFVIDMPDGVSLDEWYAVNVVLARLKAPEEQLIHCIPFDESKVFKFVPLRALPSHKEIKGNWKNEVDVWIDGANYGYNNCLDEILGETE